MIRFIFALLLGLPVTPIANRALADIQWRIGANIASHHIAATREYNETNLGGFVSATWNPNGFLQYGVQVGAYNNSYSDLTTYAMGFANVPLFETGPVEWRAGIWAGFFEYGNLAPKAHAMGVPTIGNHIFLPGPSLIARTDGFDISIGYVPFSTSPNNNGIVTVQVSVPLN